MALFVMQYSLSKIEASKRKDKAILNSYMMSNNSQFSRPAMRYSKPVTPNSGLPIMNNSSLPKSSNKRIGGNFMWVFSGLV